MARFTWTPRRTVGAGLIGCSGLSFALTCVAMIANEWAMVGGGFIFSEVAFWLGTICFGPEFRDRLSRWWRSLRAVKSGTDRAIRDNPGLTAQSGTIRDRGCPGTDRGCPDRG
jgi:hypothetical protein